MTKLYMIYWTRRENQGGHVLVGVPGALSNPRKAAMELGMNRAKTMCPGAEFLKLEEFTDAEGILWINEWYA